MSDGSSASKENPGSTRQGAPDREAIDAGLVNEAIDQLGARNLAGAERILRDVVSHTPHPYAHRFGRAGDVYIKSWDMVDFMIFAQLHGGGPGRVVFAPNAYPRAHYYLAFVLYEQGRYADAIGMLDAGLILVPDEPRFQIEKAQALMSMKQHRLALALWEQLEGVKLRVEMRAQVLRGKGHALIELGNLDAAESAYRESLALEPMSQLARDELVYILQLRSGGAKADLKVFRTSRDGEKTEVSGPTTCGTCGSLLAINARGETEQCRRCTAQQPARPTKRRFWKN